MYSLLQGNSPTSPLHQPLSFGSPVLNAYAKIADILWRAVKPPTPVPLSPDLFHQILVPHILSILSCSRPGLHLCFLPLSNFQGCLPSPLLSSLPALCSLPLHRSFLYHFRGCLFPNRPHRSLLPFFAKALAFEFPKPTRSSHPSAPTHAIRATRPFHCRQDVQSHHRESQKIDSPWQPPRCLPRRLLSCYQSLGCKDPL